MKGFGPLDAQPSSRPDIRDASYRVEVPLPDGWCLEDGILQREVDGDIEPHVSASPESVEEGGVMMWDVPERGTEETSKVRVAGEVKIDAYRVLDEAVIDGINRGWSRAHKHVETPGESVIKENMHREIKPAICEVMRFDD